MEGVCEGCWMWCSLVEESGWFCELVQLPVLPDAWVNSCSEYINSLTHREIDNTFSNPHYCLYLLLCILVYEGKD